MSLYDNTDGRVGLKSPDLYWRKRQVTPPGRQRATLRSWDLPGECQQGTRQGRGKWCHLAAVQDMERHRRSPRLQIKLIKGRDGGKRNRTEAPSMVGACSVRKKVNAKEGSKLPSKLSGRFSKQYARLTVK